MAGGLGRGGRRVEQPALCAGRTRVVRGRAYKCSHSCSTRAEPLPGFACICSACRRATWCTGRPPSRARRRSAERNMDEIWTRYRREMGEGARAPGEGGDVGENGGAHLGARDAKVGIDVLPHRLAVGVAVAYLGIHAEASHLALERRHLRSRVVTRQGKLLGNKLGRRRNLCRWARCLAHMTSTLYSTRAIEFELVVCGTPSPLEGNRTCPSIWMAGSARSGHRSCSGGLRKPALAWSRPR